MRCKKRLAERLRVGLMVASSSGSAEAREPGCRVCSTSPLMAYRHEPRAINYGPTSGTERLLARPNHEEPNDCPDSPGCDLTKCGCGTIFHGRQAEKAFWLLAFSCVEKVRHNVSRASSRYIR